MKKYYFLIFFLLIYSNIIYSQNKDLGVKDGVICIKEEIIDNEIISLNGDWQFYPNELLTPKDFKTGNKEKSCDYLTVPSAWNNKVKNEDDVENFGYGTYRLEIIHNCKARSMGIMLESISSSSLVFLDGNKVSQQGIVGINKESSKPDFKPEIIYYRPKSDTSEIIIQVSNFFYSRGGIIKSIKVSTEYNIRRYTIKNNDIDLFLIGAILIMGMSHWILYFLKRKNRSELFFGLLCLFVIARIMLTKNMYLLRLFPDFDWAMRIRLEYLTFYLGVLSVFLFIYYLYKNLFHKKALYFTITYTTIYSLVLLVSSVYFFTNTLISFQVLTGLLLIYVLIILIKAIIMKADGALVFIIGFFIFSAASVNDVLHTANIINTGIFTPYGLFIFVFLQGYILSKRFTDTFTKTEELSIELNMLNKDLENKVKKRTNEINKKNIILESQKQSIVDSILYAQRIQKAILPPESKLKYFFKSYFIIYKPQEIVSGDFYWIGKVEDRTVVAVADCTGHGVPGGFMSMLGMAFFNEIVLKQRFNSASDILQGLREKVKYSLHQTGKINEIKDGMDLSLLIIDNKKKEIQYAGANNNLYVITENINKKIGNNPKDVITSDDKKLVQISGDRQPIAIYTKEQPFTNHTFNYSPKDKIYLFSDGYADQFGGKHNRKYMIRNLKQTIFKISDYTFKEQQDILEKIHENWKGDNKQTDDILMLGFSMFEI